MKHPNRSEVRQVHFFSGQTPNKPETFKKRTIDSALGRAIYGRRLGTVEPVFANITRMLGLNRFTLRGKRKVNTQWLLFCLVHTIERSTATRQNWGNSKQRGKTPHAPQV